MRRLTMTMTTVALVIAAATAAAVPVAAESTVPVLHRDGSQAVPFEPVVGAGELILRRDGSSAVPVVTPTGAGATAAQSAFDWGDAMVGSAATLGLMLAGIGGFVFVRRARLGTAGRSLTT